jgi:hypothetical protein
MMFLSSRALPILVQVLALCTMLLVAGAAHAETGARWLILNGKSELIDAANLHANVAGVMEKGGALLTKLLGVNVRVPCELGFTRKSVLLGKGTLSESTAEFTKCETYVNGTFVKACTPHSKGKAAGVVETNPFSGLIVLHFNKASGENEELVSIKPISGSTFVTMEMGAECVLGGTITVNGKLSLYDTGGLSTLGAIHLFEEGSTLTELWVQSKTVEHLETTLEGSFEAYLPEPSHLLDPWSGEAA